MVFRIDKLRIYEELKNMNESLYSPFPYRDTDKIQEDFSKELAEEVFLKADLTSFGWILQKV